MESGQRIQKRLFTLSVRKATILAISEVEIKPKLVLKSVNVLKSTYKYSTSTNLQMM